MAVMGRGSGREQGFSLIETLAAMALTGLIVSALAAITSQWLPNWNRGFDRIQRSEAVSVALDRISADIGASEFLRPDRQSKNVLFDGSETSIVLARASSGPTAGRGLERVRIAEAADRNGMVLTRSRAPLLPGGEAQPNFADPVVLLQPRYRVSFAYAGSDRVWKAAWHDSEELPAAVLLTVHDTLSGRALPISRIAVVHISAPPDGLCPQPEGGGCGGKPVAPVLGVNWSSSSGEGGR